MKKKLVYLFYFLVLVPGINNIYAQGLEINGEVIDFGTKLPMVSASVRLISNSDSSVSFSSQTNSKGKFSFIVDKQDKLTLFISFVGYKKITKEIILTNKKLNLGLIEMTSESSKLNEVVIVSTKSDQDELDIDRKKYNVSGNMMAQSGSLSDVLRNIPSVSVNIDGKIRLRGSQSVTILINGSPSPLMRKSVRASTLQQLPASIIESIEVMTNPSAAFQPDGASGIINIILKKNALLGWNGSANINAGSRDRYNGIVNFNFNTGNLNIFSSFSARKDYNKRVGELNREYFDESGKISSYYRRANYSESFPVSYLANMGVTYTIDPKNEIGLSGNGTLRKTLLEEDLDKTFNGTNYDTTSKYNRYLYAPQDQNEIDGTLYWQHNFKLKDHNFRLSFDASQLNKHNNNYYTNVFTYPDNYNAKDNVIQDEKNSQQGITFRYLNKRSDNKKIEAGYEGLFTQNMMNFLAETYYIDQFYKDESRSNIFLYNEFRHSIYSTYQSKFGKFGYNLGLRIMSLSNSINLKSKDSIIYNHYMKFFPTLHLVYKLNKGQLQLNYSKRINYPQSNDLNPFIDSRDPRNLISGNAKLMPEIIHSTELGYKPKDKNFTFLPSLYYRFKQNGITNIVIPVNDTTSIRTQINLTQNHSAGLELIFSGNFKKIFNSNISTNFFYNVIDGKDTSLGYRNKRSAFSFIANYNGQVSATKNFLLQINCNYQSARLTAQGRVDNIFVCNLGIRHNFIKNKLSVTITASDIFKTLKQTTELNSNLIHQISSIRRDTRIIYAGLSIRFGKIKNNKSTEDKIQFDNDL